MKIKGLLLVFLLTCGVITPTRSMDNGKLLTNLVVFTAFGVSIVGLWYIISSYKNNGSNQNNPPKGNAKKPPKNRDDSNLNNNTTMFSGNGNNIDSSFNNHGNGAVNPMHFQGHNNNFRDSFNDPNNSKDLLNIVNDALQLWTRNSVEDNKSSPKKNGNYENNSESDSDDSSESSSNDDYAGYVKIGDDNKGRVNMKDIRVVNNENQHVSIGNGNMGQVSISGVTVGGTITNKKSKAPKKTELVEKNYKNLDLRNITSLLVNCLGAQVEFSDDEFVKVKALKALLENINICIEGSQLIVRPVKMEKNIQATIQFPKSLLSKILNWDIGCRIVRCTDDIVIDKGLFSAQFNVTEKCQFTTITAEDININFNGDSMYTIDCINVTKKNDKNNNKITTNDTSKFIIKGVNAYNLVVDYKSQQQSFLIVKLENQFIVNGHNDGKLTVSGSVNEHRPTINDEFIYDAQQLQSNSTIPAHHGIQNAYIGTVLKEICSPTITSRGNLYYEKGTGVTKVNGLTRYSTGQLLENNS